MREIPFHKTEITPNIATNALIGRTKLESRARLALCTVRADAPHSVHINLRAPESAERYDKSAPTPTLNRCGFRVVHRCLEPTATWLPGTGKPPRTDPHSRHEISDPRLRVNSSTLYIVNMRSSAATHRIDSRSGVATIFSTVFLPGYNKHMKYMGRTAQNKTREATRAKGTAKRKNRQTQWWKQENIL